MRAVRRARIGTARELRGTRKSRRTQATSLNPRRRPPIFFAYRSLRPAQVRAGERGFSPAGRYTMRLADQIRAMGHGDHVCLIYNTLAQQLAALAPFIH